jgi:ATP-binding protein involved in chromosome partitioning
LKIKKKYEEYKVGLFSKNKGNDAPTEEAILNALRTVQDPDLHQDLVSLGFIKNLSIDKGKVSFTLELTTPACPMKEKMKNDCEQALSQVPGVTDVTIEFSARPQQHAHQQPQAKAIPGVKHIIAVSSGKGGVGKSTVAVNLALALQKVGAKVGLMDADAYGPNIPQMVGVTEPPTADENRIFPPEANGMKVISVALVAPDDTPIIWRGPMLHSLIQQFLYQVQWGELDYLVVDMPPGTGDAQLSLTQHAPLSGAVMVTTPQKVSQSDVRRAIHMFRKVEVPVLGVVENMAYFHCPDNDKRYDIFGSGGGETLAREFDTTLLGQIPIDPRIAEGGDTGKPIVVDQPDTPTAKEFEKLAGAVAQQVSIHNAQKTPLPSL